MLLPLFLNLAGRRVVLVGGGPVAAAKLQQLLAAARGVCVVAPQVAAIDEAIAGADVCTIARREFEPADLDGRVAGGRRGNAGSEPRGGRGRGGAAALRQRG